MLVAEFCEGSNFSSATVLKEFLVSNCFIIETNPLTSLYWKNSVDAPGGE